MNHLADENDALKTGLLPADEMIKNGNTQPKPSRGRRSRFTDGQKYKMLAEARVMGNSISSVARKHGLSPSQLFLWRRQVEAGELQDPSLGAPTQLSGEHRDSSAGDMRACELELRRLKEQIRQLERQLGRKSLHVELLQEAWEASGIKKPLPVLP